MTNSKEAKGVISIGNCHSLLQEAIDG